MLIGAAGKAAQGLRRFGNPWNGSKGGVDWLGGTKVVAAIQAWNIPTLDSEQRCVEDSATGSWLLLSGHIFRDSTAPNEVRPHGILSRVLERLIWKGLDGLSEFDGSYAMAWFNGRSHRLYLVRDRFGVEPFFYGEVPDGIVFGSRVRDLVKTGIVPRRLSLHGLAEYLTYCHIPGDATLDEYIRQVPPGSYIAIDPDRGVVARERWYRLSFAGPCVTNEAEIAHQFHALLEKAVVRRMAEPRVGVFLSGGMDSSSVATFVHRYQPGVVHTFAFRCPGKSFDESVYARGLADILQTQHLEVEYGEQDALATEVIVPEMDVPFCNIGINVGTWLLGSAAARDVDYVLTGDGGDELWGSHPVYVAQRLMSMWERMKVPRQVYRFLLRLAALLPDSDHKADLRVKLKRILPSDKLPRELGHFRWQTYYAPDELQSLLIPELAGELREEDPFSCIRDAFAGYSGPDDGLSPCLYNDYSTSSSYYFKRLSLIRRFGIEARCPFYDQELVEFGAQIPARLKLERFGRTKRLFRMAMREVLPDLINERRDKLGHSIPLKNWLRQPGPLAAHINEVCGPAAIRARGLFRPEAVAKLIEEHRTRRHNHSHRIWALYVLELWLRNRDGICCSISAGAMR